MPRPIEQPHPRPSAGPSLKGGGRLRRPPSAAAAEHGDVADEFSVVGLARQPARGKSRRRRRRLGVTDEPAAVQTGAAAGLEVAGAVADDDRMGQVELQQARGAQDHAGIGR